MVLTILQHRTMSKERGVMSFNGDSLPQVCCEALCGMVQLPVIKQHLLTEEQGQVYYIGAPTGNAAGPKWSRCISVRPRATAHVPDDAAGTAALGQCDLSGGRDPGGEPANHCACAD